MQLAPSAARRQPHPPHSTLTAAVVHAQKTNFNRSQIFGYKNGIPVVVAKRADIPLAAATAAAAGRAS